MQNPAPPRRIYAVSRPNTRAPPPRPTNPRPILAPPPTNPKTKPMTTPNQHRLDRLATQMTGRSRWAPAAETTKLLWSPKPGEYAEIPHQPGIGSFSAAIAAEAYFQSDALLAIAHALERIATTLECPAPTHTPTNPPGQTT